MSSLHTTTPIHPIAVRRAFGEDREHPATPGTTAGIIGNTVAVTLLDGRKISLEFDAPGFANALKRKDLCRHKDESLVMVNLHYGLIGLAIGPAVAPSRLAVNYGISRLAKGSAVEIPGTAPQPGWLLFRFVVAGSVRPVVASALTAGPAPMGRPEPEDNEGPRALVYGYSRNGLLFIQNSTARELLAVKAARTWGDLRKGSPELYERALELTEEDREEDTTPADDEVFEIESIGAFHDGDFPYFPEQLMEDFIPDSVQQRFAKRVNTVHNGTMLEFKDDCEADVVAALRDLGFTCDKQQAVINAVN